MNTANTTASPATAPQSTPTRLLRLPELIGRVKFSRAAIYRLMASGRFPRYIKVGAASFWVESEVEAWIQERIAESRNAGA